MVDVTERVLSLGFTKLVVDDLDKASAFYNAVCGLVEEGRGDDQIGGAPIREVYFKADPPGTGTFTLTKFLDGPKAASQAVILGFVADNVDTFIERAVAAGATVVEEARSRPEYGVKVAFVRDVEDNLIEVVEII